MRKLSHHHPRRSHLHRHHPVQAALVLHLALSRKLGEHVQSVSSRIISMQYHRLVAAHTFPGCNGAGAVGTKTTRPAS